MKRRQFVAGAAATATGAGAGTSAVVTPAIAQDRVEIDMVTTWPRNFPALGTGAARLAERVNTMSQGRIQINLHAAGELVPALEAFSAVRSGTAQAMHATPYYWQGNHPAFNFFTSAPYALLAGEHDGWIRFGGGQELMDEFHADFGLKAFIAGNTGTQMGGWFGRELTSVEDVQGLAFRTAGLGGEMWRKVGVNVQTMAGGQIYQALETGALDAAEWVGPFNDLALGLHRIHKHYYGPSINEPSAALTFTIDRELYEGLPDDLKMILQVAANAENDIVPAEFNRENIIALDTLVNDHGVQVHRWPEDLARALAEASTEVVAEIADHDDISRRIVDSMISYRRNAVRWAAISEQAFADIRQRDIPFNI